MAERPMVDLPAPDSPMRPRTLPLSSLRETPSTMVMSCGSSSGGYTVASILRFRISSSAPLCGWCLIFSATAASLQARCPVEDPVGDEIDRDGERGDRGRGNERRADAEDDAVAVLAHHAAPVGIGRLDAEAQEGQRRQEQHRIDEAQPEFGNE